MDMEKEDIMQKKLETMANDVVSPNANGETVNEAAEPETEETATTESDAA